MAQFDVYRIDGHGLVVDCQSDLLRDLRSRIVVPLRDADEPSVSASKLNPLVEVDGSPYRVAVQFLRAVDQDLLRHRRGSLLLHEYEIKAALDMLISGF